MTEQKAIAFQGSGYIAIYVLLWAGSYIYVDIHMPESNGAYFLMSFASIGLNFFVLYSLTQSSDARGDTTKTGIAAFFGLSILHSIGVFIGLVLVILPGLYLALRWLPAFARLLKSDEGIVDALGWSWERTSEHQQALALPFIGVLALYILGMGPIIGWEFLYDWPAYVSYELIDSLHLPAVIVTNIVLAFGFVWYTVLGVASYVCLRADLSIQANTFD